MSIIFKDVTKVIGKSLVIDDVNIEIPSNQVTGFKGINGSGKTMLMRLIAGLIYPTRGTVSIDGKTLGNDITFPPSIGIMLENPAFLNGYTCYENLCLLADIKSEINAERIKEVLDIVGLTENMNKKYRKYSLGMKQRLGIAAAIMEKPDIILLDEPTNSLDESGVEMVKRIVRAEKERGATVIISCHDGEILDDLADEVINIKSGKITGRYVPHESEG